MKAICFPFIRPLRSSHFVAVIHLSRRRMNMNSTMSRMNPHYPHELEIVNQSLATNNEAPMKYDSVGAALFIVVVLLWYSIGLVCTLGIQIRARAETIEDNARRRAKLFIRTLPDQTETKELLGIEHVVSRLISFERNVLEELADKEKRAKLWAIYWGTATTSTDQLLRDERLRIGNIKKQLAILKRNRMIMNDTFLTPLISYSDRRPPSVLPSIVITASTTSV